MMPLLIEEKKTPKLLETRLTTYDRVIIKSNFKFSQCSVLWSFKCHLIQSINSQLSKLTKNLEENNEFIDKYCSGHWILLKRHRKTKRLFIAFFSV